MPSNNKMIPYEQATLDEKLKLAQALAKSKRFKGDTNPFEVFVKIQAGLELGIPPVQALTQVHVVQGKVTLGAGIISAKIKESDKYDFSVEKLDDEECVLKFYEKRDSIGNGRILLGESRFSMSDAKAAGLTGKSVWKQYPRNMLYARAVSNGARWYTPDVFMGGVYTQEELGEDQLDESVEEIQGVQLEWQPDFETFLVVMQGELGMDKQEIVKLLTDHEMLEYEPEKAQKWKELLWEVAD